MKEQIKFHCGGCGCPLNEKSEVITEIPEGYKPEDYPASGCWPCVAGSQDDDDPYPGFYEEER